MADTDLGEEGRGESVVLEDDLLQEVTGILSRVVRSTSDGDSDVSREAKSPVEIEEEGTRRRTSSWKLVKRMSLGSTGTLDHQDDDDERDGGNDDGDGDGDEGWPETPYAHAVAAYQYTAGTPATAVEDTEVAAAVSIEPAQPAKPRRPSRAPPPPPPNVQSHAGMVASPTSTSRVELVGDTGGGRGGRDAHRIPASRIGLDAIQKQLELLSGTPLADGIMIHSEDGTRGRVLLDVSELEPGVRWHFASSGVYNGPADISVYRPVGADGQVVINGSLFTYPVTHD